MKVILDDLHRRSFAAGQGDGTTIYGEDVTAPAEVARLRSLLGRYALHVYECEGTDFLGSLWTSDASDPLNEAEGREIAGYMDAEHAKRGAKG